MEIVWQKEINKEANDYLIKDLYCVLAVMGRYVVAHFNRYITWQRNDLDASFIKTFDTKEKAIAYAEIKVFKEMSL